MQRSQLSCWGIVFEASLWREGGREKGGRRKREESDGRGGGRGGGGGGLALIVSPYKSGIADASPDQTTGYSGLSASITEAKEAGRVRDPPSTTPSPLPPTQPNPPGPAPVTFRSRLHRDLFAFATSEDQVVEKGAQEALCSTPARSATETIDRTGTEASERRGGGSQRSLHLSSLSKVRVSLLFFRRSSAFDARSRRVGKNRFLRFERIRSTFRGSTQRSRVSREVASDVSESGIEVEFGERR